MSLRPTGHGSSGGQLPPNDSRTVPDRRRDGKPRGPPATTMGNKKSKETGGGGGGGGSSAAAAYSYSPTSSEIDLNVRNTYNSILNAGINHMRGPGKPLTNWSEAQVRADPARVRECYNVMEPSCGEHFNQLVRLGYCSSIQAAQQAVRGCLPGASVASSSHSSSTASTRSGIADFSTTWRQHTYTGNHALVVHVVKKYRNTMGSDYGDLLLGLTLTKMKHTKPPAAPQGYSGKAAADYIAERDGNYVHACLAAWDASVAETSGKTDTQLGAMARFVDYR